MNTVDRLLNEAAEVLRDVGDFTCLTFDHENGVLWAGRVGIRVTHDDKYALEVEIGHDCLDGQTVADAQAIIEERIEGLTDSSVEIGDPIINEDIGQVRVSLGRKCDDVEGVVRWVEWWQ